MLRVINLVTTKINTNMYLFLIIKMKLLFYMLSELCTHDTHIEMDIDFYEATTQTFRIL